MKTKFYLEILFLLWIKWTGMVEIKHKDFMILFIRSRIYRVYTDIKIANNTKINHIMVSFTNYYNANSIHRLPSKTKIEKYSWYFNNTLLCKSEVNSATKTFIFLLKTKKNKHSCSGSPATVRFSYLFQCHKYNLSISNVNYLNKEY